MNSSGGKINPTESIKYYQNIRNSWIGTGYKASDSIRSFSTKAQSK